MKTTFKEEPYKKTGRKANCTKEEILQVLEDNKGLIYNSLKQTGLSSSTFYRWMDDDPAFKEAVDRLERIEIAYTRSKLAKLIDEENPQAIMFYMKTKGGFSETKKVEATVNTTDVIDINATLQSIKDEINSEK